SAPSFRTFAKDLVTSAQAKGVPVAPLQMVLGSLVEAGIYERRYSRPLVRGGRSIGRVAGKARRSPMDVAPVTRAQARDGKRRRQEAGFRDCQIRGRRRKVRVPVRSRTARHLRLRTPG